MTAVLGILNKNAVALAADSAVTVMGYNGKKISNTANKIFTLSKHHPVGIAIYNSASLMATPWEIIIKLYRKKLGEKYFSTIKDYQIDFIEFLKEKINIIPVQTQKSNFSQLAYSALKDLLNETNKIVNNEKIQDIKVKKEFFRKKIAEIAQEPLNRFKQSNTCNEGFQDYSFNDFIKFSSEIIETASKNVFGEFYTKDLLNVFLETFFYYIRSTDFMGIYSGLVFAGFGEDEIYPSCVPIRVAEVFDNQIRYSFDESQHITDEMQGSIMPFAQRDVIDTIITGVNPDLNDTYINTFSDFLLKYNEALINIIHDRAPQLSIDTNDLNIEQIVRNYQDYMMEVTSKEHIRPTVDTVAILSKEDLAEMAESLIYLTYLKRKITFAEESVGGPVDVALISKGDGFIWIKRKQYFKPELNTHFFKNY